MTQIVKTTEVVRSITPLENKPSITVKNLDEFFKNGPHLDPEDAKQFKEAIEEFRRNSRQDIKKWLNGGMNGLKVILT